MVEYIDRDKVLSMSYCTNKPTWDNPHLDPKSVVDVDDIEALPTADVQKIKHGKWINSKRGFKLREDYECSLCHSPDGIKHFYSGIKYNYCPHCGAKMDKENE